MIYSNPYKFNGKELDTETGLAYYGARYYSPELSVWYGVDPLMEKYPQNGKKLSTTVTKWDTLYITTRQTYRKSDSKVINIDTLYIGNLKP